MIRLLTMADAITLANGVAGTAAILATLQYLDTRDPRILWLAFGLLPLALVFDVADGRVARRRRTGSTALGRELDSLADLISFGVAPAVLGFAIGLRGAWDAVVLLFFVSCGLARLARYNVSAEALSDDTGKVRYFEGTPIPTSLVLVAVLMVLAWIGRIDDSIPLGWTRFLGGKIHPLVGLYFLSGCAMISRIRIPKP